MCQEIRVRFAPSPTGSLHIGSVRTALFNWLFAKHLGGKFVLRIEDTDPGRSTDESIQEIIDGMKWLGLDWDEGPDVGGEYGPYRQTERKDIYLRYVDQLIGEGKAYRCYCSVETLEESKKAATAKGEKPKYDGRCRRLDAYPVEKPHVVRFKNPETGSVTITDLLRGGITFNNSELDDFIILRTDGSPTYNFVVVVDDIAMKISHVIRGDDHLSNTPRQAQIYNGLGWPLPKFAHISMIMGADKARLSKRHGATSILDYRDQGFLPEAMINYLARLGWSHGDDEIFTRDDLVEKFSLDNVNTSAAVFNPEKLQWVNAQHIKVAPVERLAKLLAEQIRREGIVEKDALLDMEILKKAVPLLRDRSRTLSEMADGVIYFIQEKIKYDEKAREKFFVPGNIEILRGLAAALEEEENFSESRTEEVLKETAERNGVKLGQIAQPLRVALTGRTASPGIFEVMAVLGKERTLARIKDAVDRT
jgi:glutamyl-tRNA synthetase